MIDYNSPAYKIAINMYKTLDGDPNKTFTSIEEIYTEIDMMLNEQRRTLNIEPLEVTLTTNGMQIFNNETVTGYKPVKITVDVPTSGGGDVPVVPTPSGSGYDFTVLGYSQELSNELNAEVNDDINYSLSCIELLDGREGDGSHVFNGSSIVYAPFADTSKIDNLFWCFAGSKSLKVIPLYDFSNVTNMEACFQECKSLKSLPLFDTGKVTNMQQICSSCDALEFVPAWNTVNVTNFSDAFQNCFKLRYGPEFTSTENATNMHNMFWQCQQLQTVPHYNTSNVTDMSGMFQYCWQLASVPQFDTSNVTNMSCFVQGSMLTSLPALDCSNVTNAENMIADCWSLDTIGGFINLGMQPELNDYHNMSSCPNLTKESMLNIMNNLYDRAANGYSVPTIQFPFDAYTNNLTEEDIAIGTSKGWNITM